MISFFHSQHFRCLLIHNGRDMTGEFLWIRNDFEDANNITGSVPDILRAGL